MKTEPNLLGMFIKDGMRYHLTSEEGDTVTISAFAAANGFELAPRMTPEERETALAAQREASMAARRAAMPSPVPKEIANWRAKAVLEIAGLLPTVEATLAAMPGEAGIVARSAWAAGAPFARNGPTVTTLSVALGLTGEQVDAMFRQAAAIAV